MLTLTYHSFTIATNRDQLCGLAVKTLAQRSGASVIQEELDKLHEAFPHLNTVQLDVCTDKERLQSLIKENSIVISLLPYCFHHKVALICIEECKNLVTASYVDDEMKGLHQRAVEAGVTILCEAGLDPGIDHMIAKKCVDALHSMGGEVTELRSVCGGIPADENTAGCMKYKFSWYPKVVFTSALQPAQCLVNGKIVEFEKVYEAHEDFTGVLDNYKLECLPNRDALRYKDVYGIQTASSLFRGTLRYQGFSKIMQSLTCLGLMNQSAVPELESNAPDLTWKEFLTTLLGLPSSCTKEDLEKAVMKKLNDDSNQLQTITELELMSDKIVAKKTTPLDSLCAHLATLLAYVMYNYTYINDNFVVTPVTMSVLKCARYRKRSGSHLTTPFLTTESIKSETTITLPKVFVHLLPSLFTLLPPSLTLHTTCVGR
ncbi:alpha-aminoadipic semialdehyde synthase, mitochondrial [Elysia marginata]|uniref:Alpha-aminoadipic semialdehyde synthase, mitochondrial n=1 Tax=Elysia marginata TaxID=1093978 RepID=A0AAV4HEH8_9GAST|nr:alpha-aminoadipic semialdehyde synthase, mitochondrial [Elysia marginata]